MLKNCWTTIWIVSIFNISSIEWYFVKFIIVYVDNWIIHVNINQLLKNEYLIICLRLHHLIINIDHSNNVEWLKEHF
jgi:hypothetical protein